MKTWMPITLYGMIAVLNHVATQTSAPTTSWGWVLFVTGTLLAGAIAVKAKVSPPNAP